MRRIMVANPKGGSGKSTLVVHLASWFARNDELVYLGDLDRQRSTVQWLAGRPRHLAPIRHWEISGDAFDAPPKDCTVAILDTPAGLHGKRLKLALSEMDKIVVPVSPSRFDMLASRDFFEELAETKAVRKDRVDIALVGMRVDPRTNASRLLVDYLKQFDLPLITCIRQSQRYVQAVETGVTLFDGSRVDPDDQLHWKPLLDWLVRRR